jgi:hypothetical protein
VKFNRRAVTLTGVMISGLALAGLASAPILTAETFQTGNYQSLARNSVPERVWSVDSLPDERFEYSSQLEELFGYSSSEQARLWRQLNTIALNLEELQSKVERAESVDDPTKVSARSNERLKRSSSEVLSIKTTGVPTVPFFSQFKDIASPYWQKVGCGIASTAMIIEYYQPGTARVEALLQQGINNGSFLSDAGWIHSGLINLTNQFGLDGSSHSLAHLSMSEAFSMLESVLKEGPVMASVHYTFEPTNPIPHLVVINGVREGMVYYNDPAEVSGGGAIPIEKFQSAWKKRYIEIRPVS